MKAERHADDASEARARHPSFFKAGTIERLVKWRGVQDGKRLPYTSKLIAVALLGHAQSNRGFTCLVSEPELCDELAMDPKTLRKYLQPLVEFGLIQTDRAREGGAKRYDCSPIYRRFGEQRTEPASKVSALPKTGTLSRSTDDTDRDVIPARADAIPVRPGNLPQADRDSVPVSYRESPSSFSSSSSSHLDASAPAARLGVSQTTGIEREILVIDDVLTSWGWLRREQRRIVKRYGVIATAGAIGYVLQQQALYAGTIREPSALFRYALRKRLCSELPTRETGTSSQSEIAKPSGRSFSGASDAVRRCLQERLSEPVYEMFVKRASIDFRGDDITITCADAFAANFLRSRYERNVKEAVSAVLGMNAAKVAIVPAPSAP